jgi:hypothetical protein
MGAFARWRALTGYQRQFTIQSGLLIGFAVVLLRAFGVERTLRIASRPVKGRARIVIGDAVTAVDRAGRYVPGATCLTKSLALAWMLRGRGVVAEVRIGVKTTGGFDAHAWVECDGVAVENIPHGYVSF